VDADRGKTIDQKLRLRHARNYLEEFGAGIGITVLFHNLRSQTDFLGSKDELTVFGVFFAFTWERDGSM
jgi:hypothetical protein